MASVAKLSGIASGILGIAAARTTEPGGEPFLSLEPFPQTWDQLST
jgi:hypothetical protein